MSVINKNLFVKSWKDQGVYDIMADVLVVRMPEWTIGSVCKTDALIGYPGSNPGPDTTFAEIAQW